jgi:hypothetical protein
MFQIEPSIDIDGSEGRSLNTFNKDPHWKAAGSDKFLYDEHPTGSGTSLFANVTVLREKSAKLASAGSAAASRLGTINLFGYRRISRYLTSHPSPQPVSLASPQAAQRDATTTPAKQAAKACGLGIRHPPHLLIGKGKRSMARCVSADSRWWRRKMWRQGSQNVATGGGRLLYVNQLRYLRSFSPNCRLLARRAR